MAKRCKNRMFLTKYYEDPDTYVQPNIDAQRAKSGCDLCCEDSCNDFVATIQKRLDQLKSQCQLMTVNSKPLSKNRNRRTSFDMSCGGSKLKTCCSSISNPDSQNGRQNIRYKPQFQNKPPTNPTARRNQNLKNQRNKLQSQSQDHFSKPGMAVINEEQEECLSNASCMSSQPVQSKEIQDSCTNFLNIVQDTVLDSVKTSLENSMCEYIAKIMDKVEFICTRMMQSECLLSKMYMDISDKITDQQDRSLDEFKRIYQYISMGKICKNGYKNEVSSQQSYGRCTCCSSADTQHNEQQQCDVKQSSCECCYSQKQKEEIRKITVVAIDRQNCPCYKGISRNNSQVGIPPNVCQH